jgi:hypothetical protein
MVVTQTRGPVNQEGLERKEKPKSKAIAPSFTIEAI